jgi:hypothetical protein
MLASILSKSPVSHFFSEIGLNRGMTHGFNQLDKINADFSNILTPYAKDPVGMIRVFGRKILPQLYERFSHIGIKECFHDNWQLYLKLKNRVRFVVLARDPRDVMLSVLDYGNQVEWHRKNWSDRGDEYIAFRFNEVWAQQREMIEQTGAFALRYEDLCQSSEFFKKLCRFCDLPLDKPAAAGGLVENYPWRLWETEKHGSNEISMASVFRWRFETPSERTQRAMRVGGMMRDYCKFWGYEE